MYKRARVSVVKGPKRPVDKKIIQCSVVANSSVTQNNVYVAPTACTLMGVRVRGQVVVSAGPSTNRMNWALQYIREGQNLVDITPSAASVTGTLQTEQNILYLDTATQTSLAAGEGQCYPIDVVIKTKRKMLAGDSLLFITDSISNGGVCVSVIITAFIKQ